MQKITESNDIAAAAPSMMPRGPHSKSDQNNDDRGGRGSNYQLCSLCVGHFFFHALQYQ